MTQSTRTRRSFLGLLTGGAPPEPTRGFSLARFYAKRQEEGQATTESIPEFELAEGTDFAQTSVGTPNLKPGPR